MRKMYDAAFPPTNPPDVDVAAGYIGGNTPHVWTDSEWAQQKARYRLPIFTRSHDGDALADAKAAVAWMGAHNAPKGCTLALDFETRVDSAYLLAFDGEVMQSCYRTMVYGSRSYVLKNPKPSGGYWDAEWNNIPHLNAGSAATQYGGDTTLGQPYDLSLVADTTPLWDTQGDTLTIDEAVVAINTHSDDLYKLLARASDGRANLTGLNNKLDKLQTTVSTGGVDPATVADAVAQQLLAELGPELAGAVCEEMSARLAQ
jgi:hypothetical protein